MFFRGQTVGKYKILAPLGSGGFGTVYLAEADKGARPFAWGKGSDGNAYAMVNLRCIPALDPHALEITKRYDGRAL